MKEINTYEIPFRPAFEFRAAFGWLCGAVWIGWKIRNNEDLSFEMAVPAYLFLGICLFVGLLRATKGFSVYMRRKGLLDGELEFITLDKLKTKVESFTRKKKIQTRLWIGLGFLWTKEVAERAYDLMIRGEEDILGKNANAEGALWLHGVGLGEEDVFQEEAHRNGHTLVVGTTGAGKTRLFDLSIAQDILRGECVIIIDPKGDKELANNAKRVCEMMGTPERFAYFHPAFPEESIRFDPLKNWSRSTELASRLAALIPSETGADPFQAFGWMALNDVVQGMLAISEQPSLKSIRKYVEGGIDDLLVMALRKHFEDSVENWESRVAPSLSRFKGDEASAYMEFIKKEATAQEKPGHLEGLMRTYEHNREHYQKMIASLMPILSMLTSSPLDKLLSPTEDTEGRLLNSTSAINKGMVLYIGLDSLSDATVGSAIGSIILSDLTAVAGDRYNYGVNNKPVNIYVDEAAEVLNKPTIQLLNKGRGAGFRLLIATQTIADFIARLGDESMARQVLGNLNNKFILRVMDGETQKYLSESLQTVRITTLEQQVRNGLSSTNVDAMQGMVGETIKQEDLDLIPPPIFGKLPNLHFFASLASGQVIKSRIPIVTEGKR